MKKKLFQILNNFRNEEEKVKREQEEYFKHYCDNKIKYQELKKYLDEEDKRANFLEHLHRRGSGKKIFLKEIILVL